MYCFDMGFQIYFIFIVYVCVAKCVEARGVGSLGVRVTGLSAAGHELLEPNSGLQEEQEMLLTLSHLCNPQDIRALF